MQSNVPSSCLPYPIELLLTCGVDVKVSGFVSHVSHGLQAWSTGSHLAGVPERHAHVDFKGAPVDILACKQDSDLRENSKGKNQDKSTNPAKSEKLTWTFPVARS